MQRSRYKQAKDVTLISSAVNILLAVLKVVGGFLFQSHALIADGVHSFSDLLVDIMVIIASKYGSQAADETHPYGHQRIETAATFLLALLLVLAGIGISWDAIDSILNQQHDNPALLALPIALLSIGINELLFHYTRYVGRAIYSPLLITNAWHHRSDAAASGVVALGLLGSFAGLPYFDTLAATIVGFMIIKMGLQYGWNSIKELVDTAVDENTLFKIRQIISSVYGIKKIHQLRSRFMGRDILVDVHIQVEPHISVSEGHYLAQQVHKELLKQLLRVKDVIVHVDPEDDETFAPSLNLPNRKTLEEEFIIPWQKQFPFLQTCILHYLEGHIHLELICTKADIAHLQQLEEYALKTIANYSCIKEMRVLSSTN